MAQQAGVSTDLIQSLEQGRAANPTLRSLRGIARALKLTITEVVAGLDEEKILS
jgi:transcriptional regulator with XRE-family HTH domain